MNLYVALLRGINVGGKNLIKMSDLAACFQEMGFSDVRTYIQSGNVLFATAHGDLPGLTEQLELERRIEAGLSQTFAYQASVVLRSAGEMQAIVAGAPPGFGAQPQLYRSDVIFLKAPLSAPEAMQSVSTKEGVDQAFAGEDVLYFAHLISRAGQSRLTRIAGLPIYQQPDDPQLEHDHEAGADAGGQQPVMEKGRPLAARLLRPARRAPGCCLHHHGLGPHLRLHQAAAGRLHRGRDPVLPPAAGHAGAVDLQPAAPLQGLA